MPLFLLIQRGLELGSAQHETQQNTSSKLSASELAVSHSSAGPISRLEPLKNNRIYYRSDSETAVHNGKFASSAADFCRPTHTHTHTHIYIYRRRMNNSKQSLLWILRLRVVIVSRDQLHSILSLSPSPTQACQAQRHTHTRPYMSIHVHTHVCFSRLVLQLSLKRCNQSVPLLFGLIHLALMLIGQILHLGCILGF
jgi:hypothetical protein